MNFNTDEQEPRISTERNLKSSKDDRLWSPVFVVIICCSLCCFLVGQGSNAGSSVYLGRTGGDAGMAGIGAIVFSFAAAFGRIGSGPFIDRRGRMPLMVAGALVMLAGTIGPMISNADALFIVWRAFQGFGFSIATTAGATAAADVLPLSRLGEGIGYYGIGQALSNAVGPALAIFLISTNPPENFYIGLTIFSICAFIFALLCKYEKNPDSLPKTAEYRIRFDSGDLKALKDRPFNLKSALYEPAALRGAVPMMIICVAYGFGIFFIGLFGSSIGVDSPGLFFTVAAISMVLIRIFSGRFMDKIAPIFIFSVSVGCGIIVYLILFFLNTQPQSDSVDMAFYATGLLYGVSLGIAIPINQTVAVRLSPSDRWGAANGLFFLANDISIGIASLICGFAVLNFGYGVTFIAIICCIASSLVAAFFLYPKGDV